MTGSTYILYETEIFTKKSERFKIVLINRVSIISEIH